MQYGHLPPISQTIYVDEQENQDTAGKVRPNSYVTFFYGLLHTDIPGLAD